MKTDAQIKADIQEELEWDPTVSATDVGVLVTLTRHLRTCWCALRARVSSSAARWTPGPNARPRKAPPGRRLV
jgi:hypothetical protein